MYKLEEDRSIPSINASITELADFLEVNCILDVDKTCSIYDFRSTLSASSDETDHNGIDSPDDRVLFILQEALDEIANRHSRCNEKYPFSVNHTSIQFDSEAPFTDPDIVYLYLLFATRLVMNSDRVHCDIDGTLLFEELCEQIAKEYFGARAQTHIFGTSNSLGKTSFEEKVTHLLRHLKEGPLSFRQPEGSRNKQNDGKLDIVVWKPFADERSSKLIGFGQCKTGTNWETHTTSLHPRDFFTCYTTGLPCHDPARLFFITDSCIDAWGENSVRSGILFDRSRIMDYLPAELPNDLICRIRQWVNAVLTKYNRH